MYLLQYILRFKCIVYAFVSISCLQWKKCHLYGAILCYKEQAVEKETHGISSTTLCLYLRVTDLHINQDTSYPDGFFMVSPSLDR
jgi:hypothetical protein